MGDAWWVPRGVCRVVCAAWCVPRGACRVVGVAWCDLRRVWRWLCVVRFFDDSKVTLSLPLRCVFVPVTSVESCHVFGPFGVAIRAAIVMSVGDDGLFHIVQAGR